MIQNALSRSSRNRKIRRAWFAMALTPLMLVALSGTSCEGILPSGAMIVTAPTLGADDVVFGDQAATLVVFQYTNFECGACRLFAQDEFAQIKAQYIDTGKVRWVFRYARLASQTDQAEKAFEAALCAGDQGLFLEFHDETFANTNDLSDAALETYAGNVGVNLNEYDECIDGDTKLAKMNADADGVLDIADAATPPVTSLQSPVFIIGDELVYGFKTADTLGAIIDQKLAE